MLLKDRGDWIQTYTGKRFYPLDPQPEDIEVADIAHALSLLCRFGGHCNRFYSVAQHSIEVADACETLYPGVVYLQQWSLVHDGSEAYIVDIPSPVKKYLPDYKRIEAKVMAAICERFGLDPQEPPEVKEIDRRILGDEMNFFMEHEWTKKESYPFKPLGYRTFAKWDPSDAEFQFMITFNELWDK